MQEQPPDHHPCSRREIVDRWFRKYAKSVAMFLHGLRRELSPDAVGDLVQRTFVRALKTTSQLPTDEAAILQYLKVTARREAIQEHRRVSRESEVLADYARQLRPAVGAELSRAREEFIAVVEEKIAKLGSTDREILEEVKHVQPEKRNKELSDRLGMSVEAIEGRVGRAKENLKTQLKNSDIKNI